MADYVTDRRCAACGTAPATAAKPSRLALAKALYCPACRAARRRRPVSTVTPEQGAEIARWIGVLSREAIAHRLGVSRAAVARYTRDHGLYGRSDAYPPAGWRPCVRPTKPRRVASARAACRSCSRRWRCAASSSATGTSARARSAGRRRRSTRPPKWPGWCRPRRRPAILGARMPRTGRSRRSGPSASSATRMACTAWRRTWSSLCAGRGPRPCSSTTSPPGASVARWCCGATSCRSCPRTSTPRSGTWWRPSPGSNAGSMVEPRPGRLPR